MQVQDTNWFASEIESSFDHYKVMFTNNLSAILDLMTLKENKYRSIKCLSANTSIFEMLFRQQDYDEWQSVQDYQSATENHQEIYSFDKVIKLSKKLLKSKLLRSSNEIKMIANHMKNARHIRSVKWISEAQRSQKQDHSTNKMHTLQITNAWVERSI